MSYKKVNYKQNNHSNPASGRVRNSNNRNQVRSAKKGSTLNPDLLVKEADRGMEDKVFRSDRLVSERPLDSRLKQALSAKGYKRPPEIQD